MYAGTATLAPARTWVRAATFGLLLSLGILIPSLGLPQVVTGPLVNALLFISVITCGVGPAMLVGMVTPLNGLLHGVLPLPLAVMLPFIALGNAILVGVFGALRQRNYWLGVVAGSVAKFAFLYAAVTFLAVRPLTIALGTASQRVPIPAAIAYTMQWPQLATALVGGVLAFGLLAGYRAVSKR